MTNTPKPPAWSHTQLDAFESYILHPHVIFSIIIGGLVVCLVYQTFMAVLDWQRAEEEADDDDEW